MIKGKLYEINSSTYIDVELFVNESSFFIKSHEETILNGKIERLKIGSRIANAKREIILEDKRVFITNDNDLVDSFLLPVQKRKGFIHKLESNLFLILISLLVAIFVGFSFLKYGIPYFSKKLAFVLPNELTKNISEDTLKVLDKYFFKKSKLDEKTKQKIILSFDKKVLPYVEKKDEYKLKIHFRDWKIDKKSVANAFALPSGDIVLTDEFVKLSKNEQEINSVIFHEVGHVIHKHSLQQIIEGTFISVFVMYITGDGTAFSDMGVGLGSLFINSDYTRNHEREADKYAFEKMLKANINPKNFSNILNRISKSDTKTNDKKTLFEYFSSHPTTKERELTAKKYQYCFEKKIYPCNIK